jgi:hypothetical protein
MWAFLKIANEIPRSSSGGFFFDDVVYLGFGMNCGSIEMKTSPRDFGKCRGVLIEF